MRVLVTSFTPFNNFNNNYSTEVINYINGVTKVLLDVLYDDAFNILNSNYNLADYDLIIALGEARMRNVLTVEKYAKNISSCSLKDNGGNLKIDEIIINDGANILQTKLNLELIKEYASISDDAGKFVCNNLYYHLLYTHPEKSLFIHIPECNNDISEYKKYAIAIENIISILVKEK